MVRVVFDEILTPGPLDPANWELTVGLSRRTGIAPAAAQGKVATCRMGLPFPFFGGDTVDYLPPPFDVRLRDGTPAAGFIQFPLVVVP